MWTELFRITFPVAGYCLRVTLLPDPRHFKLFVGTVLLVATCRLIGDIVSKSVNNLPGKQSDDKSCKTGNGNKSVKFSFGGQQVCFRISAVVLLGGLFGVGGRVGMICGARVPLNSPERFIKLILTVVVCVVSAKYIWQYF